MNAALPTPSLFPDNFGVLDTLCESHLPFDTITRNKRTRMYTAHVCAIGHIHIAPPGTAGEWHQISVMAAGCSTSLTVYDGARKIFHFPVLQTGSFKMEAAFHDGLSFFVYASIDAPPHITVCFRIAEARLHE